MGTILNLLAAALFVIWMVEYFAYNAGQNVHILLGGVILIFLVKVIFGLSDRKSPT